MRRAVKARDAAAGARHSKAARHRFTQDSLRAPLVAPSISLHWLGAPLSQPFRTDHDLAQLCAQPLVWVMD